MKKSIFIISSSRAELYLLKELFVKIDKTKKFTAKLILTGTNLNKNYGISLKEIKKNFGKNVKFFNINQNTNNSISILNCVGDSVKKFGNFLKKNRPSAIIILGDRYETLSIAISSMFLKIPIIHLHGGEVTEGALDENIRHAISKFASYHFVSNDIYKRRVIQLGENPKNVYCVGSIGVENALNTKLISKKNLEKQLKFKFRNQNFIITFHPETYSKDLGINQFKNFLSILSENKEINFIFTRPNADQGNKQFLRLIKRFVSKNKNSKLILNLGQERYFSILKHFDGIIGNSSSGIIEAPSLKCVTLNIGNRQKGRLMSKSIINCLASNKSEIRYKFTQLRKLKYKKKSVLFNNPYFKPNTTNNIIKILNSINLSDVKKKPFYNIK